VIKNNAEVYAAKIDEDENGHGHGEHKDEHGNMAKFIKVHDEMVYLFYNKICKYSN
jgi:hypothetical protein